MPLYQYQALDSTGKKRTGFLEATDEREAKSKLREQGLMVKVLTTQMAVSSKQNLNGEALVNFTSQLAQLTSAGIPLYQSLLAIEEQYRGEPYHRIILSLCDQIKAGKQLSQALEAFPNSFDSLYCSMIAAGESAGALDAILEKLNELLFKQSHIRQQIVTAMLYPAFLAGFSLLAIAMLLTFVLPSIEGVFADRELNSFTQIVLAVSHFFRDWWWLYIPLIAAGGIGGYRFLRSPKGGLWLQRNLLKVPVIKTLVIQTAVARFCRTMSTLQQGGLTMIDSLRLSRRVMGNVVLEEEIEKAENRIIEGSSLSSELIHSPWFPKLVSRMLAVGEDSGSTTVMLDKIADTYEREIDKTLSRVMALTQPVILIFMGGIIAIILLAVLLPMTDFSALSR
jgi:general secretion pathway protein F/type IV pilus assembly protein PilC